MKKILFFLGAFSFVGFAQAQQRMVLAESFSQASCGPCASQNPAFHALLAANSSKIIAIKYQVSWPGYDPMYLHNPTEISSRVSYYSITGVPDRVMDGTNMDVTQGAIDTRYAVPSPVNMSISHTVNPGFSTADVTVTITAPAVWNPSNTVLRLAMVEKEITFATAPGTNGETEFKNVMRKMIGGTAGTAVVASNFAAPGGSQTFTFTNVPIPDYLYKLPQMGFIAWVQNDSNKEVYQAGMSEPLPLSDYAIVQSLNVPTGYSCASDISGVTGTFVNQGTTTISSATINYSLNGGAVQTIPFAGAILPNGTHNFTIPTLAVTTTGTQTVTSYLTDINASGLTNPVGSRSTSVTRIIGNGSTGPFSQNFSSNTFPYANYYVTSPTNDNWVRVATNVGSLYYNNYNFAAGRTSEVYIAPVDMTAQTNTNMSFEVAYCQYQNENDKLDVLASTDCGVTWTNVYSKQGAALSTKAAQTSPFTAPTSAQWRTETVNLAPYATSNKLILKFKATSAYGNNLFVDNINIAGIAALIENDQLAMNVYPNPATNNLNVTFEATGDYTVSVVDLQGRTVASQANNAAGFQMVEFDVTNLAKGSYIVNIVNGTSKSSKNIVVQ